MTLLEALIMGIVQGLSEFLPVSSSGHLEIFKVLLGVEEPNNLLFTVVVHGGTALSTVVVYFRTVRKLTLSPFGSWRSLEFKFLNHLVISAIPVVIIGLFFLKPIEALFDGNLVLVGSCLLVTSGLLYFASRAKEGGGTHNPVRAFIIGLAQAVAVLPGISRSGATISMALILGMNRAAAARFSFLMVLIPIFGAMTLDAYKLFSGKEMAGNISHLALGVGFLASFVVGLAACSFMIKVVKRGGLLPFAIYCLLAGLTTLAFGLYS